MGKESRGRSWAGEDMSKMSSCEGWKGGQRAGEQMKEKRLV